MGSISSTTSTSKIGLVVKDAWISRRRSDRPRGSFGGESSAAARSARRLSPDVASMGVQPASTKSSLQERSSRAVDKASADSDAE